MAIQRALESQKGKWFYDQIMNWNKGIMDHDGAMDEELLKRLKYGPYVYADSKIEEVGKLMRESDDDHQIKRKFGILFV